MTLIYKIRIEFINLLFQQYRCRVSAFRIANLNTDT
jgi:hypothetical protein